MEFLTGLWKSDAVLNEPVVKRYASFGELRYAIHRPSIQREIMEDSVLEMRKHIQEMYKHKLAPVFGVIDVCILEGIAYVIDGQHRLKALQDEWNANKIPIPFHVMEYQIKDKMQLEFIFTTRNKGIPVPGYILCDEIEGKKRDLLKAIHVNVSKRPLFVSTGGRNSYRPRVCTGEFMEQLGKSRLFTEIWSKYSDYSVIELADYFETLFDSANLELAKLATDPEWVSRHKISHNMISTCVTNKSFFGLTMDRLYFEEFFIPRAAASLPTFH
jgi:hypothetical protein